MIEINLEEGMPSTFEAIQIAKDSIESRRMSKDRILVFIHGYGSSGKGGAIKRKLHSLLDSLRSSHKIRIYIPGERFGLFNEEARNLYKKDSSLSSYYNKENDGITVVLV